MGTEIDVISNGTARVVAARLALLAMVTQGLGACAPDTDLQQAAQNVDIARAKLMRDRASGDAAQVAADSTQLAQAEFVLKYDRMQWPDDSPGHGAHQGHTH